MFSFVQLAKYAICSFVFCGAAIAYSQYGTIIQYNESKNGPIRVVLSIVDERGVPVKGVKVNTRSLAMRGYGTKDDFQGQTVDGAYTIEKNCAEITISLIHPDYFPVRFDFVYRMPQANVQRQGKLQIYNITAVMKKVGRLGNTIDFQIGVSWSKDGYKVEDISSRGKDSRGGKRVVLEKVKNIDTLSTMPKIYVEVVPSKAPKPAVIHGYVHEPISPKDLDVFLVLDDGTGQCGFLPVDPSKFIEQHILKKKERGPVDPYSLQMSKLAWGLKDEREYFIESGRPGISRACLVSMTEAPEVGYQKRIPITNDHLVKGYPLCFYFKMNGHYGKGYIFICSYNNNLGKISISANMIIALDGTRNLTTYN